MNKLALILATFLSFAVPAYADGPGKGEVKKVCEDKKDKNGNVVKGKDGKPQQECKDVKVRKKLEGTDIKDAKKDDKKDTKK